MKYDSASLSLHYNTGDALQSTNDVTLSKLLAWLIYAEGVFLQGSLMQLVKAIVRETGQCQLVICHHAVLSLCRTLVV